MAWGTGVMERPSPKPLPTWRERARRCGAVAVGLAAGAVLAVGCVQSHAATDAGSYDATTETCTPGVDSRRDCVGRFCGGPATCDSWCTSAGVWSACMCPVGVPCDAGIAHVPDGGTQPWNVDAALDASADAASVDADATAPEPCDPSVDGLRECAYCGYPFNCGCREQCMPDGTWGPCHLAYGWICDTGP